MRYYVITPKYGTVDVILDDGTGPVEYSCDVIEIEAETKQDAIALGVKEMLKNHGTNRGLYQWCWDARADGENPYAGVIAEPIIEDGMVVGGTETKGEEW